MPVRPYCPTCDRFVSSHVPHVDRDLGRECITPPELVLLARADEMRPAILHGEPVWIVHRDE